MTFYKIYGSGVSPCYNQLKALKMSVISQLDRLASAPTSLLTWYAKAGRLEFTGPVIYRWLAKTANYLNAEFGEDSGALIVFDLPQSWRTAFWVLGAQLAGSEVSFSLNDASSADLVVTASAPTAADILAEQVGLPVLLQDMGPLALRWLGEPVAGAADAIAEINSQADGFLFPVSAGFQVAGAVLPEGAGPVFLTGGEANYIELIWAAWSCGRRVVWVEPGLDAEGIRAQELAG
ncbi:MAG: TIGR03089 family protein [Actinomycetaceae bacterium]|nr:TIGR03089 family protein [Actinomycetaceae bacterium]